jgi:hypothetical protein
MLLDMTCLIAEAVTKIWAEVKHARMVMHECLTELIDVSLLARPSKTVLGFTMPQNSKAREQLFDKLNLRRRELSFYFTSLKVIGYDVDL